VVGGGEFVVGCLLEGDERVVGVRQGGQELVQFALSDQLFPGLGVLDHEHQGQRQGPDHRLKDGFQP